MLPKWYEISFYVAFALMFIGLPLWVYIDSKRGNYL